jgi:hypothetical protein
VGGKRERRLYRQDFRLWVPSLTAERGEYPALRIKFHDKGKYRQC